jgi:hypothetical protein
MGIGMQIAHVAFSGTASLECEAAMQLLLPATVCRLCFRLLPIDRASRRVSSELLVRGSSFHRDDKKQGETPQRRSSNSVRV